MRFEVHARELRVRDAAALGIDARIESAADRQASLRRRGGDETHDHLVCDEGLAAPVLGDEREQAVFDLVPLILVPGGK